MVSGATFAATADNWHLARRKESTISKRIIHTHTHKHTQPQGHTQILISYDLCIAENGREQIFALDFSSTTGAQLVFTHL